MVPQTIGWRLSFVLCLEAFSVQSLHLSAAEKSLQTKPTWSARQMTSPTSNHTIPREEYLVLWWISRQRHITNIGNQYSFLGCCYCGSGLDVLALPLRLISVVWLGSARLSISGNSREYPARLAASVYPKYKPISKPNDNSTFQAYLTPYSPVPLRIPFAVCFFYDFLLSAHVVSIELGFSIEFRHTLLQFWPSMYLMSPMNLMNHESLLYQSLPVVVFHCTFSICPGFV